MSNAPAFLYSSVLTGWPNELSAKRRAFTSIDGDAGAPVPVDSVGICMPDASGTLQVYSSTDNASWTLRASAPAYSMRNSLTFFESVTAQYWRVTAVGFASAAVIKLGRAVRMAQDNYGNVQPPAFNQSVNMTPQEMVMGQWLGRQSYGRTARASYQFDHITASWVRANAMDLIAALRTGAGAFFAWRPDKYPQDVIYGHLSGAIELSNSGVRDFMTGTIAIDGVYDASYDELPAYSVTPPL
jgi:hypothetical protein